MVRESDFQPAWWLRNHHLQTMAAKFLRKRLVVETFTEVLELPDGDFVDISWTEQINNDDPRPLAVVLHGLEGSKDSHYAKGMLLALKKAGFVAVLMHFRGCSGRPNRLARAYHSGETGDIHFFTEYLQSQFPNKPMALVGFSLGGNVAVRYLAQYPNNPYRAAAVVCAPLDLASCSRFINSGSSKIYQNYLLNMLKASTTIKIEQGLIDHLTPNQVAEIDHMWQFDDLVTAPLHDFNGAADYYQKASGGPVLSEIKQPCLVIHAQDDPFLSHSDIVKFADVPEHVEFEVSKRGGHVGFIAGSNPFKPNYWLEPRVTGYLRQYFNFSQS